MGYKAWVGGKSAWVRTDFGVKRGFGKNVGTAGQGIEQNTGEKKKYRFLGMDGNFYESYSLEAAKNLAGPGAIQVSKDAKKNLALVQEVRKRKRKYNKG